MTTLRIGDLPRNECLDQKAMQSVQGGMPRQAYLACFYAIEPLIYGDPSLPVQTAVNNLNAH
jgi:hypothetical protein